MVRHTTYEALDTMFSLQANAIKSKVHSASALLLYHCPNTGDEWPQCSTRMSVSRHSRDLSSCHACIPERS